MQRTHISVRERKNKSENYAFSRLINQQQTKSAARAEKNQSDFSLFNENVLKKRRIAMEIPFTGEFRHRHFL
jgi:hypothetical protein